MRKALLLALGVAACGPGGVNPADVLQPDVRVHHLAIRNLGLSGGTLDVVLAFHNPNGVTLKGLGLTAGLDIEGNHFGDIDMPNPFSMGGKDTTLITVPLTFRYANVGNAARSVLELGAVNYSVNGKFTVNTPVNTSFDVPFSGRGNVPLLRP